MFSVASGPPFCLLTVGQAKQSKSKAHLGKQETHFKKILDKGSSDQGGIKIRPTGVLFHNWKAGEDMAIASSKSFQPTDEEGRI